MTKKTISTAERADVATALEEAFACRQRLEESERFVRSVLGISDFERVKIDELFDVVYNAELPDADALLRSLDIEVVPLKLNAE